LAVEYFPQNIYKFSC